MRRLLWASGGAALASAAVAWAVPPDDAFRSTLAVLPWVVVALAAIERGARGAVPAADGVPADREPAGEEPANALGALPPWLEGVGLGALGLAVLGREHLGLGAPPVVVDGVLAAGLLLLLGHRVWRLWPALRRAHSAGSSPHPGWIFFALPLAVYLAVLPWSSQQRPPDGDEPYYLLLAHSLAFDLDADLANNYAAEDSRRFVPRALAPEWADPRGADGEVYSRHNLLLPLLVAPAYRLAGAAGVRVLMTLFAATAAWLFLAVARRAWPGAPAAVLGAWAMLALAPPLLAYAHQIWVEVPAICLLLLALDRLDALAGDAGRGTGRWIVLALALVALPLLKLRLLLISIGLLALAWWRVPRARRVLAILTGGVAAAGLAMLIYNHASFGTPFKDHTFRQMVELQTGHPERYPLGAAGLLFDCAFGLFAVAPIWLLGLTGAVWLARQRRRLPAELLVLALPYLVVVAPRLEWYGAWSPPFRLGMVLLPLAALSVVPVLAERRRAGVRAALAALAGLTLALTLLWTVVPGWTYNPADGSSHLLAYLAERWEADAGRFFPSFVRPRAASLWAPLAALALALALARPRRPRPAAARAGLVALLAGAALLPLAATTLPTRVIELEDRQVTKSGGQLYPSPWTPGRALYRGGWILEAPASLAAPLVAGAGPLEVELELRLMTRAPEGARLELSAGDARVASWPLATLRGWQSLACSMPAWPESQPLVLRLVEPSGSAVRARVLLDRVRLRWRARGALDAAADRPRCDGGDADDGRFGIAEVPPSQPY